MIQEDKELLLKDLSARLPYGVLCEDMEGKMRPLFGITPTQHFIVTLDNATDGTNGLKFCTIDCVKPYLRPMSSMTEEEKVEYYNTMNKETQRNYPNSCDFSESVYYSNTIKTFDWLNAHHFDYRGLIDKGLAIAVIKENNPYKGIEL